LLLRSRDKRKLSVSLYVFVRRFNGISTNLNVIAEVLWPLFLVDAVGIPVWVLVVTSRSYTACSYEVDSWNEHLLRRYKRLYMINIKFFLLYVVRRWNGYSNWVVRKAWKLIMCHTCYPPNFLCSWSLDARDCVKWWSSYIAKGWNYQRLHISLHDRWYSVSLVSKLRLIWTSSNLSNQNEDD
jgi:hypothetical protein